jgi:hypothetical protein
MYQIIINGLTLLVKAEHVSVVRRGKGKDIMVNTGDRVTHIFAFASDTVVTIPPAHPSLVPPIDPVDAHDLVHDYHKRVA